MSAYTDEQLDNLVTCLKCVTDPPRTTMKEDRGSRRNDMLLQSKSEGHRFRVFLRQSIIFWEDFSIGLDFLPRDELGSICLLRCNGRHGAHELRFSHHLACHVHKAKADDVNNGIKLARHIEPTTKYATFNEALIYFLVLTKVEGAEEHFPDLGISQMNLFSQHEGVGDENH